MRNRNTLAGLVALLLIAAPAAAQGHGHGHHGGIPESGLRAELVANLAQLEQKYVALADALVEHHAWRPAEGVRSVGEVFGHVAAGNFMLPTMAGVDAPARYSGEEGRAALRGLERADAATVSAALRESFAHLRHAIGSIPDAELDASTTLFGREATKRAVLLLIVNHLHEHLGQAIAYARTNGVAPPWSG